MFFLWAAYQTSVKRLTWKQLVSSPHLGPAEPEDNFELLRAEKLIDTEQGTIRFVARRYRFQSVFMQWRGVAVEEIEGFPDQWKAQADHVHMVERWGDFCAAVARRNLAAWANKGAEAARRPTLEELLTRPSTTALVSADAASASAL